MNFPSSYNSTTKKYALYRERIFLFEESMIVKAYSLLIDCEFFVDFYVIIGLFILF